LFQVVVRIDLSEGAKQRGMYRMKRKMPQQTTHSRKKRLNVANMDREEITPSDTVLEHAGNCSEDSYSELQSAIPFELGVESELADTPTRVSITELATHNETAEEPVGQPITIRPQPLYEGSSLSADTAHLLVSSYMCCHNLTGRAKEDLLRLLQLLLPQSSSLSSSLYMLKKQANHSTDITPDFYYFCPNCYSIFADKEVSICPNRICGVALNQPTESFFMTVSVAEQLKVLLKSKFKCYAAQYLSFCVTTVYMILVHVVNIN